MLKGNNSGKVGRNSLITDEGNVNYDSLYGKNFDNLSCSFLDPVIVLLQISDEEIIRNVNKCLYTSMSVITLLIIVKKNLKK